MGDRAGAFVSQNDGGGFDDDDDNEERPSLKVREYDSDDDGVGKLGPTEVTIPAPRRAPGEDAPFVFGRAGDPTRTWMARPGAASLSPAMTSGAWTTREAAGRV